MDGEIEYRHVTMRHETVYWIDDTTIEDASESYQVERARLSNGKVIYRFRTFLQMPDERFAVIGEYQNGLPPTRAENGIVQAPH